MSAPGHDNGDAPVLPGPVPMTVNVTSMGNPAQWALLTITTATGPQCYWFEPDVAERLAELLKAAAVRARSGLIITDRKDLQT